VKRQSADSPTLDRQLLARLLPAEMREALLSDFDEAFHEHVVPARAARTSPRPNRPTQNSRTV
jgi:hypothetical protein